MGDGDNNGIEWLTANEQRAWRAFIDGSQRLIGLLNRDLTTSDSLSIADYRILVLLSEAPTGALRMSEIADGIVASRSKLTHQARRMEAAGLIHREACSEDGRGVCAHITDTGRAALRAAARNHVASVRAYFVDLLDEAELDALTRIFEKIDNHVVAKQHSDD
ncbi:winged helix-turn-helix transcriptional regulator [Hoyosella sp. G463]|uniref:Winged helix-turn-helix transcriptional regulator n=2 Tax=Lolliginicoccus lacisalsi TaxID=2742202 RepID=A0A927PMR2_9ACTN|nr:winged helix-turn-helix transcriptional regulator [Lolliginicoccus lacisalsi]